jgi:FtsZ-interacting cell division protein ZipA
MGMSYSEKGYFYYNSLSEEQINFTLLNGMKPGVFDNNKTSMVSLVLDTKKNNNPVESFKKMLELAQWFSDSFDTDLLDESRNFLTKQMIDHMRQQAENDHQKYLIASGSV